MPPGSRSPSRATAPSRSRSGAGRARADHHATPADASANGCGWPVALEIPVGDWPSGYYAVTLTAGDERAEAFLVVRAAEPRAGADPARALDEHVRRLQRLGRSVPVYRCHTGLDAAPDGAGVPHEAGAAPAQDAAAPRPRGAMVLRVGRAARPVGVERWRRMVELGAPVPALGRAQRLPVRCRDQHGPGDRARAARRVSIVRLRRPRRVLVVGHARGARRAHGRRRQRGDLQRQHVLLAGPVRPRRRHDDVLQVPLRRGPGARHSRTTGCSPARGRIGGSAGPRPRRSGSRSPEAATRATGSACLAPRARSRCTAPSIGSSRAPICATATRSGSSTRSSRTRWTDAR